MHELGSVTVWLNRLKDGNDRDEVVARLWQRYFASLLCEAQKHLRGKRSVSDGEDVALAAFDGFVRAVEAKKFPKLNDRDDLWQVLLHMTANRARNAVRDENRDKRGGGWIQHRLVDAESDPEGIQAWAFDPDPAESVALAEEVENMLTSLGKPELQRVAVLTLEGRTQKEIAAEIGKALATVERKLKLIRQRLHELGYAPKNEGR
jgi:RNA polymerase sigma factor (sigma-70 family)